MHILAKKLITFLCLSALPGTSIYAKNCSVAEYYIENPALKLTLERHFKKYPYQKTKPMELSYVVDHYKHFGSKAGSCTPQSQIDDTTNAEKVVAWNDTVDEKTKKILKGKSNIDILERIKEDKKENKAIYKKIPKIADIPYTGSLEQGFPHFAIASTYNEYSSNNMSRSSYLEFHYAMDKLSEREKKLDIQRQDGYTHFYIAPYLEKYRTNDLIKNCIPVPGKIDCSKPRDVAYDFFESPKKFIPYLKEIIGFPSKKRKAAKPLLPVVWLFTDSPGSGRPTKLHKLGKSNITRLKMKMTKLVKEIDPYVSSYVLGKNLDQFWSQEIINQLGHHLKSITKKKIGINLTAGEYKISKASWVNYHVHTFKEVSNADDSESYEAQAKRVIKELQKPVISGNFFSQYIPVCYPYLPTEEQIKVAAQKRAAAEQGLIRAGISGFANGGNLKQINRSMELINEVNPMKLSYF